MMAAFLTLRALFSPDQEEEGVFLRHASSSFMNPEKEYLPIFRK